MKNALARCVLVMFVLLQATFPMRAYSVVFIPPIVYAGVTSVAVHAGVILLTIGAVSLGSSSSSSSSSGGRPVSSGFGPSGAGAGGIPVRLDGNTSTQPTGWPTKTTPDGSKVPVPPPAAPKQQTCYYNDGYTSAPFPTCQAVCTALGYKSGPDPSDCYDGTIYATGLPHFYQSACPSGYQLKDNNCALTNPKQVQKPQYTPCEPVFDGGKFQYDPNNSACPSSGSSVKQTEANGCQSEISAGVYKLQCADSSYNISDTAISYQSPSASGSAPISIHDGAVTISVPSDKPMQFPGGFLPVTVDQFGTYSCDSYGLCTPAGVSSGGTSGSAGGSSGGGADTGGGSSSGGNSGGGSGSGTSSGGSAGTSSGTGTGPGSGSGSGAGTSTGNNQTALDDSAFQGMGDKAGKAGADGSGSDEGAYKDLRDGVAQRLGFLDGFGFNWVPVPRDFAQCKPIPYAILGLSSSWDFCPYVDVLSHVMGYLFYVFTAVYLYRLFTSSSKD